MKRLSVRNLMEVFKVRECVLSNNMSGAGLLIPLYNEDSFDGWKIKISRRQSEKEQEITFLHEIMEIVLRDNEGHKQFTESKAKEKMCDKFAYKFHDFVDWGGTGIQTKLSNY